MPVPLSVDVQVATIAAIPATIAALGAWRISRNTGVKIDDVRNQVGNGQYSSHELLYEMLRRQGRTEEQITAVEIRVRNQLDVVESNVNRRLSKVEDDINCLHDEVQGLSTE